MKSWVSEGRCVLLAGTPAFVMPAAPEVLPGLKLKPLTAAGEDAVYRLEMSSSSSEDEVPAADAIVLEAEQVSSGNVVVDNSYYGIGIGVITSPRYPAYAQYSITMPVEGPYSVYIRLASEAPRPLRFSLNNKLLSQTAGDQPTGGYGPAFQRWQRIGVFQFAKGVNLIRLDRDLPFPHVDKLAFRKTKR